MHLLFMLQLYDVYYKQQTIFKYMFNYAKTLMNAHMHYI